MPFMTKYKYGLVLHFFDAVLLPVNLHAQHNGTQLMVELAVRFDDRIDPAYELPVEDAKRIRWRGVNREIRPK